MGDSKEIGWLGAAISESCKGAGDWRSNFCTCAGNGELNGINSTVSVIVDAILN